MPISDLKIFKKIAGVWDGLGKSNPAQADRLPKNVFEIPKITAPSQPEATKETRMVRRQMEENPGARGSAEAAPWMHRINRDYVKPEENFRRCFAADVAIMINPQLKAALRNFCYGAAGTFQGIKVLSGPRQKRIQERLDEFVRRTKLKLYLAEYVRRIGLYGKGYLQREFAKIDGRTVIKQLIWMPVYGMVRVSNDLDQFDDTEKAYEQYDITFGVWRRMQMVDAFEEWRIDNIKLNALPGEADGHSLIESTIYSGANDRLVESMIEAFWQRIYSTPIDVFSVNGPGAGENKMPANPKQVEQLLNQVGKNRRREKGEPPARDIVMADGVVSRLQGNENTSQIADIEMMASLTLAELSQSPQMISSDANANVGVLVERFRQLYCSEEQFIHGIATQLRDTVDFELALNGFDPTSVEYEFVFGQQRLIQDLIAINSQARADRKAGDIPMSTRLKVAAELYRDDPARMEEELEQEAEEAKQKLLEQQQAMAETGGDPLNSTEKNPDTTDREKPTQSTPPANLDEDNTDSSLTN